MTNTESFTEKMTRLQADMKERQLERDAGVRPKPTLRDKLVGYSTLAAVAVVGLLLIALLGVVVFAMLSSAAFWTAVGSLAVLAVAAAAIIQIRGT